MDIDVSKAFLATLQAAGFFLKIVLRELELTQLSIRSDLERSLPRKESLVWGVLDGASHHALTPSYENLRPALYRVVKLIHVPT